MRPTALAAGLALTAALTAAPVAAQDTPQGKAQDAQPAKPAEGPPSGPVPIRNAPSPRALEFVAYIYAASNVCGLRIGPASFEAELAKQNVRPADVGPRGPFANRVIGMFTMMSNEMVQNREAACIAVLGEYGPEGKLAKDVLVMGDPAAPAPAPAAKPAQ